MLKAWRRWGIIPVLLFSPNGNGSVAQASKVPQPFVHYHVRPGDTFIGLAARLLIRDSLWRDLEKLNRGRQARRLQPGSTIELPVAWIRWADGIARVVALTGAATRNGHELRTGDSVTPGDVVETGLDGSVALEFSDGAEITVPASSAVLLYAMRSAPGTDAADIGMQLSHGHLEISARKHRDVWRFEIRSPTAVTAVRGTRFRIHFSTASASATTETLEGKVEVQGSAAVSVSAGFGHAGRSE